MFSWYEIFEPSLAKWEERRDWQRLAALLNHNDCEVRCLAADALGRLAQPEAIERLLERFLKEEEASVRGRVAVALGRIGGEEVSQPLLQMTRDEEWEVRASAVRALARLACEEHLSILCEMLQDEHESVVVEAIRALQRLGSARAVSSLHRSFDRFDGATRELATSAIHSINLNRRNSLGTDVYFFTYVKRSTLICECYSYRLVTWRNYQRRRWLNPFARGWGVGYWEWETLEERLRSDVLKSGNSLKIVDKRA